MPAIDTAHPAGLVSNHISWVACPAPSHKNKPMKAKIGNELTTTSSGFPVSQPSSFQHEPPRPAACDGGHLGPRRPATKWHYSWTSNSLMTPAASLAVGPLQAWMIAALRRASSVPERSSLSASLDFSEERGRRRRRRPTAGRGGRTLALMSDGEAVNKHLPPERHIRRIASKDDVFMTLAFYFRLAMFPHCCLSRRSSAYSVSSCGCFEAAALWGYWQLLSLYSSLRETRALPSRMRVHFCPRSILFTGHACADGLGNARWSVWQEPFCTSIW